jgi:hypothetical protein
MALRKLLLILLGSAMLMVALSAIDVGSAAASTTEECKIPGEEEFTAPHFLDSNCEKPGVEGEYHTVPYVEKAGVILKRTRTGIPVFESTIAGVATQIQCEVYGGEKVAYNYTEGETRGFKGEGTMNFSGCTMTKPVTAGCIVSPIETVPLVETSQDLLELMRVTYAPKEGSKFMTITLSGCAIKGTYSVEGKLRSQTASIHTEEFGPATGSELVIGKSAFVISFPFHDATKSDGKTVVRETP